MASSLFAIQSRLETNARWSDVLVHILGFTDLLLNMTSSVSANSVGPDHLASEEAN